MAGRRLLSHHVPGDGAKTAFHGFHQVAAGRIEHIVFHYRLHGGIDFRLGHAFLRFLNIQGHFLAQWNRLWEAAAKLDEAHIFIDDTPGLSILDLRSRARRLQAEGGLDFIVIDYLQLMQGSRSRKANDNRQQEVTEISRGLKALARELQVPVLALSQLSRSVELRQSKQPMLSDLRESGSLEQDADIVMFLYREDYYKGADDTPSHITELIVAKHRNGPTGRVTLFFKEDCTKFISLSRRKNLP